MLTVKEAFDLAGPTWPENMKDVDSYIDSLIYILAYRKGQYYLRIYQDELPKGFVINQSVVDNLKQRGFKVEDVYSSEPLYCIEISWDMEEV